MNEKILLASEDIHFPDVNESFSQYLSFRFYRENLENLKDETKDSINIFLKSISEIEDEFVSVLQNQRSKNPELNDYGFESVVTFMEENY
ncbi:MAG: hypothetical protein ACHQF0_03980 [Chitinophagales bacterium]